MSLYQASVISLLLKKLIACPNVRWKNIGIIGKITKLPSSLARSCVSVYKKQMIPEKSHNTKSLHKQSDYINTHIATDRSYFKHMVYFNTFFYQNVWFGFFFFPFSFSIIKNIPSEITWGDCFQVWKKGVSTLRLNWLL